METLSPTYKLLIGVPGRSNAFEISKRLGLPQHIIKYAQSFTGTDRHEVESMIASLEVSRKQSEKDAEKSHALRMESEKIRTDLNMQLQQLEEQKDKLEQKAKDKARKIVEEAKRESETIIAELRTMQKNAQHVVKDHELIEVRKRLDKATPENAVLKKQKQLKERQKTLTQGDEVKVLSYGQKGTLLDKVSDSEWSVQIGILKMKVHESDLEYLKPEKQKQTVAMTHVKGRDTYVKLELDLRGERFEDAILRAEKYIDDAVLSSYHQVSIIHGKGTGALRQGIQQFLKNHSRVKSYRFGEAGEGGHGVTVVELK